MPKLKKDPITIKNELIRERISGRLAVSNMNGADLAKRAGISAATYYARMKNPDSFRISELRRIYSILGIASDDDARII